jgi:hypothetical protein
MGVAGAGVPAEQAARKRIRIEVRVGAVEFIALLEYR